MDKGVGGLKNWAIFMDILCISSLFLIAIYSPKNDKKHPSKVRN